MRKVTATIQARLGSSRLPGKCLKEISGKPLLQYQIERIQAARLVDEVVIATSTAAQDDALEDFAKRVGVGIYRGSEDDVLSRICGCLKEFKVDVQLEMLGDSPLPCPHLIDEVVGYYFKHQNQYDFVSNDLEDTYPAGLEVKVYPASVLLKVNEQIAKDDPLREHVSYHLKSKSNDFRLKNLAAPGRYRRPDVFLEVDEPADFEMVSKVIEHFGSEKPFFSLAQTLDFLDANPQIVEENQNVHRRWKQFQHGA